MKKNRILPIIVLLLSGIGLSSCVKTNCEAGKAYKIVYLNEPYKYQNWCNKHYYTIVAHLIPDDIPDSMVHNHNYRSPYFHHKICGSIPKEYCNGEAIRVRASVRPIHACGHILIDGVPSSEYDSIGGWNIYKLSCIEKED